MNNVHGKNFAQANIKRIGINKKTDWSAMLKSAQNIAQNPDEYQPNRAMRRNAEKTKGKK